MESVPVTPEQARRRHMDGLRAWLDLMERRPDVPRLPVGGGRQGEVRIFWGAQRETALMLIDALSEPRVQDVTSSHVTVAGQLHGLAVTLKVHQWDMCTYREVSITRDGRTGVIDLWTIPEEIRRRVPDSPYLLEPIPQPHDVAAQTAEWERIKICSPPAYRQRVIDIETRLAERAGGAR